MSSDRISYQSFSLQLAPERQSNASSEPVYPENYPAPPLSSVSFYELGFGTVAGVCAGVFIKKGAKALAFLLGGIFVLLQVRCDLPKGLTKTIWLTLFFFLSSILVQFQSFVWIGVERLINLKIYFIRKTRRELPNHLMLGPYGTEPSTF